MFPAESLDRRLNLRYWPVRTGHCVASHRRRCHGSRKGRGFREQHLSLEETMIVGSNPNVVSRIPDIHAARVIFVLVYKGEGTADGLATDQLESAVMNDLGKPGERYLPRDVVRIFLPRSSAESELSLRYCKGNDPDGRNVAPSVRDEPTWRRPGLLCRSRDWCTSCRGLAG